MFTINTQKKSSIIIFSKDRPDRLFQTIPKLSRYQYPIHLIDDSISISNQAIIRKLCQKYSIEYHGFLEQKKILKIINLNIISKFVGNLSKKSWNLGLNRNYALIYALLLENEYVIFMDDDVVVNQRLIDQMFQDLSEVPFIGTEIRLMPDHSIVGHIYRSGRSLLPQYVSGTFLGIDLYRFKNYFFNTYNEDWIWLFLENNGREVRRLGYIKQLKFNPFENWKQKIFFQEIGEILWDGLYYFPPPEKLKLTNNDFWEDVLEIRRKEIRKISCFELPYQFQNTATSIMKCLLKFHKNIESSFFSEQFKNYFLDIESWNYLISSIRHQKNHFEMEKITIYE